MFEPNQATYQIRHHRLNSISLKLTTAELVEIRAAQRTFEGAYARTSLSLFSFSLIVLKIFTFEFYPIGLLFAVYGGLVLVISWYRRAQGNKQFFIVSNSGSGHDEQGGGGGGGKMVFKTSANMVVIVSVVTVCAYSGILVLILRLANL